MKAKDIRTLNEKLQEQILNSTSVAEHEAGFNSLALSLLSEVAAQLAEANEHLAKIANPLMVVNQPRWVWFKYNAFRYVVDAREVASISVPDPNHCVIIMRNEGGPDPGRFCEGSYEEVCTKLGIPTEEGK
jgi:hypothetical protein